MIPCHAVASRSRACPGTLTGQEVYESCYDWHGYPQMRNALGWAEMWIALQESLGTRLAGGCVFQLTRCFLTGVALNGVADAFKERVAETGWGTFGCRFSFDSFGGAGSQAAEGAGLGARGGLALMAADSVPHAHARGACTYQQFHQDRSVSSAWPNPMRWVLL